MGLFDKKYCDICGEKIGLLGNCKLDDGNLCKECAQKLSPWFEERRHSTVEEIKRQLAYREQNKELVQKFNVTRHPDYPDCLPYPTDSPDYKRRQHIHAACPVRASRWTGIIPKKLTI